MGNNDTITFAEALRPITNVEAGKLLVVTYQGNDMLKAQILDAATIADNLLVDAADEGATKEKVFLWDNFSSLNNLTDAVTLNF